MCVVRVFPMKLLVRALQKASFAERTPFLFGQERNVRGRQIARSGYLYELIGESAPDRVDQRAGGCKQTRPGHRRKWNRDLQFRIVVAARALKGFGPAMVENILAAGVALPVTGRCAQKHPVRVFREQVPRLPTGSGPDRAGLLERRQKFM